MAANNLGYHGPSAAPETVQQRILDAVRISECATVNYLTIFQLVKVHVFLVGRQGVRYGTSENQHSLRKRGGMRDSECFK